MTEILNKNDTSKIKEYEDFVENGVMRPLL